ncbi:alkaline phosphatase family protein [Halococcus agarilyticus]|uniref:alkaline phosphatase family protein n=1 Tax=Halococcus agarilyticus TaxID=1232219 RepID=UPI000677FFF1|nr:alkaline phosphatase family protein [Halococcus agarilyticus]
MTGALPERAFVLGLDGVPFDRLRAWADAGELPNVAALFEEGAAGPLESTRPANTALAWPSIATGVGPGKHGVYSFYGLTPDYRHEVNTSADVDRPALWDLLSPAIVANTPMTYPASEIDGTMVTGMMTPSREDGFTHPPELAKEIERRVPEYEIGLDWQEYVGNDEAFAADLDSLVDSRTDLLHLLMETDDWRLFFFTYTAPDRLQHLLWEEEALLDHYRQLDGVIGDAREYAAENDATLFVVSDHGFGPVAKQVNINTLFAREGYLTPKADTAARGTLSRLGVDKSSVLGALSKVGIDEHTIVDRLPEAIVDAAATQIPGGHELYDVDYRRTKAFFHGYGNVFVNDTERFDEGIVAPRDVPALKADLTELLSSLTDPETGDRVLDVYDGDDEFPTDDGSPDLVVAGREGYHVKGTLAESVFADPGVHVAEHRPEGILLAAGPDVEPGSAPTDASVVDVAPTVLHSVGDPVPADADGRVLDEIFAPDSPTAKREVATVEAASAGTASAATDGDFGDVEDRLRGLGYME